MAGRVVLAAGLVAFTGLSGCSSPAVDCGPFDARECSILVTAATEAVDDNVDRVVLELAAGEPTCPVGSDCRYLSASAMLISEPLFGSARVVTVHLFGTTPETVQIRAITEQQD